MNIIYIIMEGILIFCIIYAVHCHPIISSDPIESIWKLFIILFSLFVIGAEMGLYIESVREARQKGYNTFNEEETKQTQPSKEEKVDLREISVEV